MKNTEIQHIQYNYQDLLRWSSQKKKKKKKKKTRRFGCFLTLSFRRLDSFVILNFDNWLFALVAFVITSTKNITNLVTFLL